ncbi:hypothetical protein [Coralloluteibacterium thermophilus]|uniref:Uncharacterized protein n=1 Tax=Coralloluteibacterium thermophilum TaxID=2707049 RepID=A0ABV9NQX4_9GAMM
MSVPVDVRAVLSRRASELTQRYGPDNDLMLVLAAVNQLIGACQRATCQCPRGAWRTDEHPLGIHQHDCHLGDIPAALLRVQGRQA